MTIAERYGPWAIVAGASEGTGRAFARRLAAEGVPSILVARRPAPLAALAAEIRDETGVDCVVAPVDLSVADAFERICAAVGDREIGLFVSNAGADDQGAHFLDRDIMVWLDQLQRNVVTMTRICHHYGARMRARGRGGILLVNSGACYGGASHMAMYSATKAFTLCFGESLWGELRGHGVDVLTLVMGMTDTPALRTLLRQRNQSVPATIATPEEVADTGFARLAHGPVHNMGQADDATGFSPLSAAGRRDRVLMIEAASARVFAQG